MVASWDIWQKSESKEGVLRSYCHVSWSESEGSALVVQQSPPANLKSLSERRMRLSLSQISLFISHCGFVDQEGGVFALLNKEFGRHGIR